MRESKIIDAHGARAVTVTQKREHEIIERKKVLCEHQTPFALLKDE